MPFLSSIGPRPAASTRDLLKCLHEHRHLHSLAPNRVGWSRHKPARSEA
jgi:hypothetical protein